MSDKKAISSLRLGIVLFVAMMLLCVIIRPVGLVVNSGISYYGNYIDTIVPYLIAFMSASFLMWRMSDLIIVKNKTDYFLKVGLKAVSIMLIGIMITPYNFLDIVHKTFGTATFLLQLFMMIATSQYLKMNVVNILLIALVMTSGLFAFIFLLQSSGFMVEAQVVFQVSIWLLLLSYLKEHRRQTIE